MEPIAMMTDMEGAPTGAGYRPGACNIGPAEIARRRRSAIAITLVTILVATALVALALPPVLRLAVLPFAAAAAVTWLQVLRRFCVGFAALGVRNFGLLGEQVSVTDAAARAADRRTAATMVAQGVLVGTAVAIVLVILPA